MRLFGFIAALLFSIFLTVNLLGQRSSVGGGHPGGVSAASYSGASSSNVVARSEAVSSAGNSKGSVSSSSVSPSGRTEGAKVGSNTARAKESARVSNTVPEKRGFLGFRHHKQPVQRTAVFVPPLRCRKGQNCGVCRRTRTCVVETSCANGLVWNGFGCGTVYAWWNDCAQLASQLAAMRQQMRGQSNPGMSLTYSMLLRQYRSCMARYGGGLLLADASLFDIP